MAALAIDVPNYYCTKQAYTYNCPAPNAGKDESKKMEPRTNDLDKINPEARAIALAMAGDTFSGPLSTLRAPFAGYSNRDLATISDAMGTSRPEYRDSASWRIVGERGEACMMPPSDSADKTLSAEIRWREFSPRRPGDGEKEAKRLEARLLRFLRKLDGGATTYEASIRRLALNGRLSKDKPCEECNGTGYDPEYVNLGNIDCAACIGTGKNPITPRKRKLAGFLDDTRFKYTLDGTTLDADSTPRTLTMVLTDTLEARKVKTMAKAFTAKRGRKNSGARCGQGHHKWNEDSTQKWCIRCGKQRAK